MAHHRCTRCKQESERRHKFAGGLFCEDCLRELGRASSGRLGFWEGLWGWFKTLVVSPFKPMPKPDKKAVAAKVAYNAMRAKALKIPFNPVTLNPQKR